MQDSLSYRVYSTFTPSVAPSSSPIEYSPEELKKLIKTKLSTIIKEEGASQINPIEAMDLAELKKQICSVPHKERSVLYFPKTINNPCSYEIDTHHNASVLTRIKLGEGSYKKVHLSFNIGGELAVRATGPKRQEEKKERIFYLLQREATIQSRFRGDPRFVQLFYSYVFVKNDHKKISLMMEYCDAGDLWSLVNVPPTDRTAKHEQQLIILFYEIFTALVIMGNQQVIHNDLKPENIFLKTDEEGLLHAKIADFGFAKQGEFYTKPPGGTPIYFSPEHVAGRPVNTKHDLWAIGAIIYHTLKGAALYDELNKKIQPMISLDLSTFFPLINQMQQSDLENLIKELDVRTDFQTKLRTIIQYILIKDSHSRPFALDALLKYCEIFSLSFPNLPKTN